MDDQPKVERSKHLLEDLSQNVLMDLTSSLVNNDKMLCDSRESDLEHLEKLSSNANVTVRN